jgi:hypothetical protein
VAVLIEHGDRFHCVEALLDGGSERTLLPWSAVAKLGLEGTLRRTRRIRGIGGRRRAWRTRATLKAQLASFEDEQPKHFGPLVSLDPWFVKPPRLGLGGAADATGPLLGRIDFLGRFRVTSTDTETTIEWDED